jgi:predicted RNA-binding Zn-ribbon protein involved in translation (DUF1610 family)
MILMISAEIDRRLANKEDPIDLEIELWRRIEVCPGKVPNFFYRPLCTVYMDFAQEEAGGAMACSTCPYYRTFEYSCKREQFGDFWWWAESHTPNAARQVITALEMCRNVEALVCPKCGELIARFGTDPDIVNNPVEVEVMFNHGKIYADCPSCGKPLMIATRVLSVEAMPF